MNTYLTTNEVSKGILEIAEKIEYMKILYKNKFNVSEKSIVEYEKDIRSIKWSIVSYLSNDNNYKEWKNSDKNNSLMFFKYFSKNHFDNEIGQDNDLRIKINNDFKEEFNKTPHELLLTNREKQNIKHYIDSQVKPENQYNYEAEEALILNLYDARECFEKNVSYLINNLPEGKKLSKEGREVIALIKDHPILLSDHPNHYIINRNKNDFPTVSSQKINQILLDSTVGDIEAMNSLKEIHKILNNLTKKESLIKNIETIRNNHTSKDTKNNIAKI